MKYNQYQVTTSVWRYPGKAAWHFVTIDTMTSEDITKNFGNLKRGWGSLPVTVTIGKTSWKTSIFPDKNLNAFILPIKGEVRQKEGLAAGKEVDLLLEIREN